MIIDDSIIRVLLVDQCQVSIYMHVSVRLCTFWSVRIHDSCMHMVTLLRSLLDCKNEHRRAMIRETMIATIMVVCPGPCRQSSCSIRPPLREASEAGGAVGMRACCSSLNCIHELKRGIVGGAGAMRNSKVLLNEGTISFCNRNVAGEAFLQEKNGKKDAF